MVRDPSLLQFGSLAILVGALGALGCAASTPAGIGGGGSDATTTTGSTTGGGGSSTSPCKEDCSKVTTPQCLTAVCNTGQVAGTIGDCVVVPANAGTACDDGQFCTVSDTCDGKGACQGGPQNDCGISPPACSTMACDEGSKSCSPAPANDGTSCETNDLCQVNGVCTNGKCSGDPKDCSFSPMAECNAMHCNPTTGACDASPDPLKNGDDCLLTGDLCQVNRKCNNGTCSGGTPKDCSAFTAGCHAGMCDSVNGNCVAKPIPAGGTCTDGITACHVGTCDAAGTCQSTVQADGTVCNDHNTCTGGDVCQGGSCVGTAITGCQLYFSDDFETCPGGWTLASDWECGTPSNVGPTAAHGGTKVIATKLAANYSSSQAYATDTATSPPINLASATAPKLSFWVWIDTEGSTYDGFNLKVSTDNGANYTTVPAANVTPTYNLTINSQPAWGGHEAAAGWQNFTADLSAFKGSTVLLRFAFRSDGSGAYPGVYIDDMMVAEPSAIPLSIISTSPLADAAAGQPFQTTLQRSGGSPGAVWSIAAGSTNAGWLTIDPATGTLTGMPQTANIGPVSVTVHIEEPTLASNFDDKTFTFNVINAVYFQNFEGACPNGWTLTGDWQCGVPTSVGPTAAYSGTQVIATKIASNYSYSQTWATCTATSPAISLVGTAHPKVTFRMWLHSEGSTYDGANLKISTNGGSTYSLLANVMPAYTLTIDGEQAWGGDQSALGWQLVTADLAAYIGQTIQLRFAFESDDLVNYPGIYVDDLIVSDF